MFPIIGSGNGPRGYLETLWQNLTKLYINAINTIEIAAKQFSVLNISNESILLFQ